MTNQLPDTIAYTRFKHFTKYVKVCKTKCNILQAGQERGNRLLLPWIKDIVNHFWYSSKKAETYEKFIVVFFFKETKVTQTKFLREH